MRGRDCQFLDRILNRRLAWPSPVQKLKNCHSPPTFLTCVCTCGKLCGPLAGWLTDDFEGVDQEDNETNEPQINHEALVGSTQPTRATKRPTDSSIVDCDPRRQQYSCTCAYFHSSSPIQNKLPVALRNTEHNYSETSCQNYRHDAVHVLRVVACSLVFVAAPRERRLRQP
jgi:hypothetical protein